MLVKPNLKQFDKYTEKLLNQMTIATITTFRLQLKSGNAHNTKESNILVKNEM